MILKRRKGITLVDALLGLAIGSLVLGAMMLVFFSTNRMGFYGQLAGTLQEGALAMAIIQKDLVQAVQQPSRFIDQAVLLTRSDFKLIRVKLDEDGSVGGDKVRYTYEETSAGNFRISRSVGDEPARYLPGLFAGKPDIAQLDSPGGPFIRVTLRMATRDVAAEQARGGEMAIISTVTRVMGPEEVQGEITPFDMFDDLEATIHWLTQGGGD